ncbi:uncharacterized protein BO95DRAFT_503959, partial [Aspergillus brunneoviolaceus CBS 621.78]
SSSVASVSRNSSTSTSSSSTSSHLQLFSLPTTEYVLPRSGNQHGGGSSSSIQGRGPEAQPGRRPGRGQRPQGGAAPGPQIPVLYALRCLRARPCDVHPFRPSGDTSFRPPRPPTQQRPGPAKPAAGRGGIGSGARGRGARADELGAGGAPSWGGCGGGRGGEGGGEGGV